MQLPATRHDIHSDNYRFIQQHVYQHTGIVLDGDKHYLLESRLMPIVRQRGLESINDLCMLLIREKETQLGREVVEAMTTNETYFFRDPIQYCAIERTLIPALKTKRSGLKRLRFWSAAASTGQEAYSLAILLADAGLDEWDIDILGTDYSSTVIERARKGVYRQIEINRGLPSRTLVKYFRQCGMDWQIDERIRRMVRFETIDLRGSMSGLGPFDVVFCRNVLIYFDAATKRRILREIRTTLQPGGWLLLGGAETAFEIEKEYRREQVDGVSVYVAE